MRYEMRQGNSEFGVPGIDVDPSTVCGYRKRPTLEDFAKIRFGSSRVVSREGAVVIVDHFDSDSDARCPLFVHGYCAEMVVQDTLDLAGRTLDVRFLDIVEVRP
jgi:hypothetical protein